MSTGAYAREKPGNVWLFGSYHTLALFTMPAVPGCGPGIELYALQISPAVALGPVSLGTIPSQAAV